jgi:hypothetical protein
MEGTMDTKDQVKEDSRGSFGKTALVMGVLAILGCICFYVGGIPFALLGIIFGIMGLKDKESRKMAVAGLVLSIGMLVFGYMIWDMIKGDMWAFIKT